MRGSFRTGVNTSQPHDSARKHVLGAAIYIDDIPEPPGMLHAALILSPVAHGRLHSLDTSRAQAAPGVVSIITAADIPGKNDIAPIAANEPLFAADFVQYAGQPVAAVAAETRDQALAAAKLITVDIEPLPAILTVAQALEANSVLCPAQTLECGNVTEALAKARRRIKGELTVGGQEHFYLEGQVAIAIPGEDDGLLVHCATQHPERSADHLRAPARARAQPDHVDRPTARRRLWRQGEQRLLVCRHCGIVRAAHWASGENPVAPRHRYGHDREAPWLFDAL